MKQRMILCAGLQSGGTTLVSWCFLQRADTNGVLDMAHDTMRVSFDAVTTPVVWCKMTVGAFRWRDVAATYRDLGWQPEPLLIVRDARAAYASLVKKDYGFNGTTAEEPPLRMRFRRFLEDWEQFRTEGWPVVKYEEFIEDERAALAQACTALGLVWDEAMITWPKRRRDVAYVGPDPNDTFAKSIAKGSLAAAKQREKADLNIERLPQSELAWLEETFAEYNTAHGYPAHETGGTVAPMPPPRFEGTARHWYFSELERLRALEVQR